MLLVEDEPGFGGWSMKHCGSMGIPCWRSRHGIEALLTGASTRAIHLPSRMRRDAANERP